MPVKADAGGVTAVLGVFAFIFISSFLVQTGIVLFTNAASWRVLRERQYIFAGHIFAGMNAAAAGAVWFTLVT